MLGKNQAFGEGNGSTDKDVLFGSEVPGHGSCRVSEARESKLKVD